MVEVSDKIELTLATKTIHNPDEPRHFMRVKPIASLVRIIRDEQVLAESRSAYRLLEIGRDMYDPTVYLPVADVCGNLQINDKQSYCPLKGTASYYDLKPENAGDVVHNIAWSYREPLPFASILQDLIAFYPSEIVFEERALPEH